MSTYAENAIIHKTKDEFAHDLQFGAKLGILSVLDVLLEHEQEKSSYTVEELKDFLLGMSTRLK